jgi:flagellar protein FliS
MIALDHERGGALAGQLQSLYRYVLDALLRANLQTERGALDSAIGVLETLASAWREIERTHPVPAEGAVR